MKLVGKPGFLGDLFDQRCGRLQPFGGALHFEAKEESVRSFLIVPLEQPAQICVVEVAFGGYLFDRPKSLKVAADVLAAALVCFEGQRFMARQGGARFHDFLRQRFEQRGTNAGRMARSAQSVADQLIKQRLNFRRRKDLRHRTRSQTRVF